MKDPYAEIPELFFATRQLIRQRLPRKNDPNGWLRSEILRYVVSREDGPTMNEIAKYLRIAAPSATSLVNFLEGKGLVRKVKSKDDKRSVCIEVTQKGRGMLKSYLTRSRTIMRDVFSKLDEGEIHSLIRILRKLQDAHKTR